MLLRKFLGYISSNYVPNASGAFPNKVAEYDVSDSNNPRLRVYDWPEYRNTDLESAYSTDGGGLWIDNYFVDAHNSLNGTVSGTSVIGDGSLNVERLIEAFRIISSEVITIETDQSGSSSALSADAVLRDYLSEYFEMPEGFTSANVTVEVANCTDINGDSYTFGNKYVLSGAYTSVDNAAEAVSVSNFNLQPCVIVNGVPQGNKLIVTITGLLARSFAVGENIPTNDPNFTGIYADESAAKPGLKFPLPKVDIRERYVVYDFCRPVEEANSAYFFGSNGHVEELLALGECYKKQNPLNYQKKYTKSDTTGELYTVEKHNGSAVRFEIKKISYSDFEIGALLKCDPYKNDGVRCEWCKLTFLPATNVHYEETMLRYASGDEQDAIGNEYTNWMQLGGVNCSWQQGGGGSEATQQSAENVLYGFDASYNKYGNFGSSDSSGSAAHVEVDSYYADLVKQGSQQWPTAHFRYTGTGFDVISRSGANTGVLAVDVVRHGAPRNDKTGVKNKDYAHLIVDTYYKDAGENDAIILHQIPVLRIERMDLKTVILNACNTPSNQSDGAQCSYEIAGLGAVFVDENSDCDYTGMDDLVCYHNPESAENIIFGS